MYMYCTYILNVLNDTFSWKKKKYLENQMSQKMAKQRYTELLNKTKTYKTFEYTTCTAYAVLAKVSVGNYESHLLLKFTKPSLV